MEEKKKGEILRQLFEEEYHSKILENIRLGRKRVTVEFNTITRFNPDLAQELQEKPEETIKLAERVLRETYPDSPPKFRFRVRGDILGSQYRVRDLKKDMIDKLITVEGTIETKTDVTTKMVEINFECPTCNNIIRTIQLGDTISEPSMCSCGRKNRFKITSSENIDCYTMRLQELAHTILYGSELKTKSILCTEDLADSMIEERLVEGLRVKINGIYRAKIVTKGGAKLTHLVNYIEANYIQISDESYYDVEIGPEDIEQIKRFAEQPDVIKRMAEGLFRGVYGHDRIKEGLVIQAFGGVSNQKAIPRIRGDIHILMVGDPGENKSAFLEYASFYNPKSVMAVGPSVSEVGLSGSVIKDELTGSFVLKPGAIALANNGICIIDELSEMKPDDRGILLEPMESQRITINKANIVDRKMMARCSFLMSMNPKNGFFNDYESIYKQIDLPDPVRDRFDYVFIMKKNRLAGEEGKRLLKQKARTMMIRSDPKEQLEVTNFHKFMRKYIAYARQNFNPEMDSYLKETYLPEKYAEFIIKIRGSGDDVDKDFKDTPRIVNSAKRIAEGKRRALLGNRCTTEDIDYAFTTIYDNLSHYAVNIKTGKIDQIWISEGVSSDKKNMLHSFEEVCRKIMGENGEVDVDDFIKECQKEGTSVSEAEDILAKKSRYGEIHYPRGHQKFKLVK